MPKYSDASMIRGVKGLKGPDEVGEAIKWKYGPNQDKPIPKHLRDIYRRWHMYLRRAGRHGSR